MNTPAFITGSRSYGIPRADSDIDLVVFVENDVAKELIPFASEPGSDIAMAGFRSLKFGKLNLLLCWKQEAYDVWRTGTERLVVLKPVSRDDAIAMFTTLRKTANLQY